MRPSARVVDGLVAEAVEIEVAVELTIDAGEQVEIEGGRHSRRIVVGRQQRAQVLLEVDADDQSAAGGERVAQDGEQAAGFDGGQVADRGAGKEAGLRSLADVGGEGDWPREVADDGPHVEAAGSAPSAAARHPRARRARRRRARRRRTAAACARRISVLRLEPEPSSTSTLPSAIPSVISAAWASRIAVSVRVG